MDNEIVLANITAERLILAVIIQYPDLFWEVMTVLLPEDFTSLANRVIMEAIQYLSEQEGTWSVSTLAAYLDQQGVLESLGGVRYLEGLRQVMVNAQDLGALLRDVHGMAVRRRLVDTGQAIMQEAKSAPPDTDAMGLVAKAQDQLQTILLNNQTDDGVAVLGETIEAELDQTQPDHPLLGISSPFPFLDEQTLGWEPGKLYVVAAPSKVGKSAMLLNWGAHAARTEGRRVLYLDTEMNRQEQQWRLLAHLSRVPERWLRTGRYKEDAQLARNVQQGVQQMRQMAIYHRYLPFFEPSQLSALIRKYRQKMGIDLVIFDYIKIPAQDNGRREEWQQLGILTTMLKDLAGQLQVPLLTAAQLRRDSVRSDQISDDMIGGSYRIVQYANMMLYLRPKTPYEIEQDGRTQGNTVLTIGASRQGGLYKGFLNFRKDILLFEELENLERDVS